MMRAHLLYRSFAKAEAAARAVTDDVRTLAGHEQASTVETVLDGLCDLVRSRYQVHSPQVQRDGDIPPVVLCVEWSEQLAQRQSLTLLKNLLYQGRPVNVLVYLAIEGDPRTVPTKVTEMFSNPPVSFTPTDLHPVTEVVWCDGTCDLSPEDHAHQHPHPMDVLRGRLIEVVRNVIETDQAHGVPIVDAILAEIDAHPVLEIRPYRPTQDAYDRVAASYNKYRDQVSEVKRLHGKPRTERYGAGCVQCGIVWPCPTGKAVGITDPRPNREGPLPEES